MESIDLENDRKEGNRLEQSSGFFIEDELTREYTIDIRLEDLKGKIPHYSNLRDDLLALSAVVRRHPNFKRLKLHGNLYISHEYVILHVFPYPSCGCPCGRDWRQFGFNSKKEFEKNVLPEFETILLDNREYLIKFFRRYFPNFNPEELRFVVFFKQGRFTKKEYQQYKLLLEYARELWRKTYNHGYPYISFGYFNPEYYINL